MRRASTVARIVASVGALGAILWRVDAVAVRHALAGASLGWVGGALAVNFLAIVVSATLWRSAIMNDRPSLVRASKLYIAGVFLNNIGLGTTVGDAYRVQGLREHGINAPRAIASVLTERVASLGALALLACVGAAVIYPQRPGLASAIWIGSACVVLGIAACAWLAPRLGRIARVPSLVRETLLDGADAVRAFVRVPGALVRASSLALVVQLCTVVATLCLMHAVGESLTFAEALAVVPIVAFAVLVPVSVQGVGVREAAYVSLFGLVGVAPEAALAAALLSYFTTLLVSLCGGGVIVYDVLAVRWGDSSVAGVFVRKAPS